MLGHVGRKRAYRTQQAGRRAGEEAIQVHHYRAGIIQRETPKCIHRVGHYVGRVGCYVCRIIKCLIIPISILIVLLLLAYEMCNDRVSVEPLQVSEKLAKRGYTPRVVAQHLIANILGIQEGASTSLERADLEGSWSKSDIVLPAAEVSLRSIAEYMRHLFGRPFPVVTGALLETEKGGHVCLRLQVNGGGVTNICEKDQQAAMDRLLEKGSREVVKAIEPYVLASYYYAKLVPSHYAKDAKEKQKKVEEVISFIFRNHPGTDDEVRAINLQGILLRREGKLDEAIEKYEEAIEINAEYAPAYNNWGVVLRQKGELEGAIKKYKKAIKINAEYAPAYRNWGLALYKSDDLPGAIKKYEKAARLDPKRALTYCRWGLVLHKSDDLPGAIKKYKKAIKINAEYAPAYRNWGLALYKSDDLPGAIKKYEKAARLDPEEYNFLMHRRWDAWLTPVCLSSNRTRKVVLDRPPPTPSF